MRTTAYILIALTIASSAAQITVVNNCTSTVTVYSLMYEGKINPYKNGKNFTSGQSETIKVSVLWSGDFWANEMKTFVAVGFNPFQDAAYYSGSVQEGFNTAMEIAPRNSTCPTLRCLGKPSDDCMNTYQEQEVVTKVKRCSLYTSFTITFCPNGSSQLSNLESNKTEKSFLSQ